MPPRARLTAAFQKIQIAASRTNVWIAHFYPCTAGARAGKPKEGRCQRNSKRDEMHMKAKGKGARRLPGRMQVRPRGTLRRVDLG